VGKESQKRGKKGQITYVQAKYKRATSLLNTGPLQSETPKAEDARLVVEKTKPFGDSRNAKEGQRPRAAPRNVPGSRGSF